MQTLVNNIYPAEFVGKGNPISSTSECRIVMHNIASSLPAVGIPTKCLRRVKSTLSHYTLRTRHILHFIKYDDHSWPFSAESRNHTQYRTMTRLELFVANPSLLAQD